MAGPLASIDWRMWSMSLDMLAYATRFRTMMIRITWHATRQADWFVVRRTQICHTWPHRPEFTGSEAHLKNAQL